MAITDFFHVNKLVLNGIPIDLKLYPSSQAFILMSKSDNYEVKLIDCTFRICHVHVNSEIITTHVTVLKEGAPAIYNFTHTDLKNYTISPGLTVRYETVSVVMI